MKQLRYIGILFVGLVLAMACNPKGSALEPAGVPSRALSNIDSLMWRQPDSAFAQLLQLAETTDTDSFDAFDRHYFQLLVSELLYKNDYAQSNRHELRQAVAFFDSLAAIRPPFKGVRGIQKTIPFLDARAHYINGVGYYENDSVVEACSEYLKALEVMEDRFNEKELEGKRAQFIAFTYIRLTEVFSSLYLHNQVIYFGKESLVYYNKYNASTRHVAWMLNEIGSNYDMMQQTDSADYYYGKAINLMKDTTSLMYRNIVAHQACLEYKKNRHNATCSISDLKHLLSEAESNRERMTRYSYIGEILFQEEQYDSAWIYLSIVFQETPDNGIKRQAAERLVEICKAQKRDSVILEYADFLVPFANQEENNSEIKSQLTEIYKSFVQERMTRQHNKERFLYVNLSLAVTIGLLLVILAIILLYHKNKSNRHHLESIITNERQAHVIQQSALAGRLKQSNAALKKHTEATRAFDSFSNSNRKKCFAANYEEEPVCQHILALCNDKKNPIKSTVPVAAYVGIALNDVQKAQLKDAALHHYGLLFKKLKQEHSELKEKDFLFCYLCLLGLDNAQISALLQNSMSTIWEREKRLKKILGSEDRIAITLHRISQS